MDTARSVSNRDSSLDFVKGILVIFMVIYHIMNYFTTAGAEELGEVDRRTVAAFQAGHDLLLFGSDFELASHAFDYFCDCVRLGEVSEQRLQRALDRVSGIKFKLDRSVLR